MFQYSNDSSELIENFSNLISQDQTARESSEMAINQKMVADPIRFIHACGEILSQDGHHASAYFYALLFIGRSITPNDVVKIESIRNIWMSTDEDQRRSLKDAIFRGLMFPDPTVNNEAIQAFCKLFKIEREFMFPDIDRLLHLIGSPEYNKAIHINGLKVLNEICAESLHNIIGQYGEEVQGVYTRVFNFVGGIFVGLQSSINYNLDICIILCEICTTLIKYAAPLFYPREVFDKFVILVQNYLNMIGNNPTNEQLEFHRNLIQIYTTLTMRFYEYDGFKFIDIGNAILNYLFEETNNGKLLNILDFWIELTKFEMKKVKAIQFKQRYENLLEERQSSIKTSLPHMKDARIHHMRDLILPVLGNLVPRLIQMLTFMREDDQQPEDPNQPTQIYGKAFQVLSNIYEYHPDCVFSEIQKYWSQNNPLASPYPVLHSLLLAIAIISRPPQSPQQGNDVYNYLTRNHLAEGQFFITKFLVQAIDHPINRVSDTALYVISLLEENFDLYMAEEFLQILIQQMQKNFMRHPIITERVFSVVNQIILRCYNFNHISLYEKFYEYLGNFCAKFLDFFTQTFNAPQSLLQTCSYVMINLIKYAPDSKKESVEKIFNQSMSTIDNSKDFQNAGNSANFALVSDSIYFVTMCFHRFPDYFRHYGVSVAQKLLGIIRFKNVLFEECLYGLISIISSLGVEAKQIFQEMSNCIDYALKTRSPSTINTTLAALAELYRNILVEGPSNECGHELLEKIPTTFEIISNCLDKFNFTREINVKILRSFAKVIKTVSPILCIEDRDRIMNIFESFLNTPLNLNDKDDGKFAPELYTVVIRGYEALLYTVKPEELDNRKLKKFFINTLVDKISNMTVQSFECLSAILDYFKTYNDVFGTKGNIILNRAKNYQLVLFAYCLSLPGRRKDELNLKQKAKELFEIMKKA